MVNGKDSCSKFRIPNGKLEDMNYIISLAKNEGWNSGIHDGLRTTDAKSQGSMPAHG
jgi:hypothetical protein